ncbi:MAG TPA: GntR family transcriptional regulator [Clostridia bacterium]|nr:GntR family transcriptional regulator [Clostridia bacterium]
MLNVDKFSSVPIYEQITQQFLKLIISGSLKPEDQIPSVRSLSMELSINPNTIQKAYNELESRGITSSVPGVGRFVSKNAPAILREYYSEKLDEMRDTVYTLAEANVDEERVLALIRSVYENVKNDKEKRSKS